MSHITLTVISEAHRLPCFDCGRLTHRRVQSQAVDAQGRATHRSHDTPVCGRITCG